MAIVTISRGTRSGGQTLAECLSRALNAPCIGREIVVEAAARLGVSNELLQEKIQKSPGFFERFSSERRTYILSVQAALAAHAASGNLVYHGQAGHLLLRGLPGVLRVRLIAPMATRVRAVVESHGLGADEAEGHIRSLDAERARWTRAMYGVDIADPGLYDLVINLETISINTACAVVQLALRQPEYEVTQEVLARLREFAATCRAQLEAHQRGKGAVTVAAQTSVLIVDQDEAFAADLVTRLRGRKVAAQAVASAREALRRIGTEAFDVVLLDLDAGSTDGLAALRQIRALDPSVQVVVVTGHGTAAAGIEGMQLGAADFLQKPVDLDVLCTSIDVAAETTRGKRSHND